MSKVYETVIGLEVHVELATKTKIFCGCSTAFGGAPYTHTCPVCTGLPCSLPILNRGVVEQAVAVGLATNCTITQNCKFDRKNYFYPDNPQNYQISQLYYPICRNGKVEIVSPEDVKIGETIVIRPGEKVPLDGVVIEGNSALNTIALTGESMPRDLNEGDTIMSGCINLSGVVRVRTTKSFGESTVSKIISLVESADKNKSKLNKDLFTSGKF